MLRNLGYQHIFVKKRVDILFFYTFAESPKYF